MHHMNSLKKKHTILSTDAKKLDKIQYPVTIKTQQIRARMQLNMIKGSYTKPITIMTLAGERLNTFPLRWKTRQGCLLSPLLFNIILEILSSATRQETKGVEVGKELKLFLFVYNLRRCTGLARGGRQASL